MPPSSQPPAALPHAVQPVQPPAAQPPAAPSAQPPAAAPGTTAPANSADEIERRLSTLERLRQKGLITEQEYQEKRAAILKQL